MKKPSFHTLRRKPVLALALAQAMLGGTSYYMSTADSRAHQAAAKKAAAAHVDLLSSLAATSGSPKDQATENAAVAVLQAATASSSALAFVPED